MTITPMTNPLEYGRLVDYDEIKAQKQVDIKSIAKTLSWNKKHDELVKVPLVANFNLF